MKKIDKILQRIRIIQANKFITHNMSVLDIGCHQGELFHQLKDKNITGVGIDTVLSEQVENENFTLFPGIFPDDLNTNRKFDAITLLAVLEHVPEKELIKFPSVLKNFLDENGIVIITIPAKFVDVILYILKTLRLIEGMDLSGHQDFSRSLIKHIFIKEGYRMIAKRKFELGLNTLYVFKKEG